MRHNSILKVGRTAKLGDETLDEGNRWIGGNSRPIKMIASNSREFPKPDDSSACGTQYSNKYATSSHDHSIPSSPHPQKPLLSSFKMHLCRFHPIQRMTLTFKNQHLDLLPYTPHIDPFRGVPTLQRMIKFNSMRRCHSPICGSDQQRHRRLYSVEIHDG